MDRRRSVLVVDDHPMLRAGLKSLLEASEHYRVVGEAGTAAAAVVQAAGLKPDLLTLDLSLPDQSGLTVIRDIRAASPETAILVVSMHTRPEYVRAALAVGARGYVAKESAEESLLLGLGALAAGRTFVDKSLADPGRQPSGAEVGDPALAAYEQLTRREQEVLRQVAQGLSSKAIAERLFLSPRTVENHRASILEKLDLRNAVEIVRFAMKYGLVPPSE